MRNINMRKSIGIRLHEMAPTTLQIILADMDRKLIFGLIRF